MAIGLDFVVLGPVKATTTHPGATCSAGKAFAASPSARRSRCTRLAACAPQDMDDARRAGAHGLAMIRGAWA